MQRDTTSVAQVVADKASQPPAPERVALKQKLAGIEGFEAQAAALAPPDETTTRPPPATPKAPVTPPAPESTTEPTAAPAEVAADEVAPPPPAAEAEVAAAKTEADRIAAADAGAGKAKASKGKSKRKDKPKGAGGLKTNGPEEIVATYGTVAEADKRQGTVQVYWVDGLKTVKKPGRKGKGRKTTEELEGIDQIADPDWDELAKKPKRGKGAKAKSKAKEAEAETEQVAVPKTQTIPVHEKLVPTFSSIFQDIKASGDWRNILERPWAHNARQNRNKPVEWSVHSWGSAMDVNPTTNPNAPGAKDYEPSERQQNIAKHFTSRGFTWLKDSDAMHFQLHSGGTPRISDEELEGIIADDQLKERDKQFPGTSRESLIRDTRSKMKLVERDLKRAEKARDKHKAKTPPTKAKALAKHERKLAQLEQDVAKYAWWMAQYQAIVDKLEGVTKAPAEAEPTQAGPADTTADTAGKTAT